MKIRELQESVAEVLNGVAALVQGGCKAIAEDRLSVISEVQKQLQTACGVALVVTTPEFTRNGCASDGIPVDARIVIQCIEIVQLNRARGSHLTALDAAEIVSHAFDDVKSMSFSRITQTVDERSGSVTAGVEYLISTKL